MGSREDFDKFVSRNIVMFGKNPPPSVVEVLYNLSENIGLCEGKLIIISEEGFEGLVRNDCVEVKDLRKLLKFSGERDTEVKMMLDGLTEHQKEARKAMKVSKVDERKEKVSQVSGEIRRQMVKWLENKIRVKLTETSSIIFFLEGNTLTQFNTSGSPGSQQFQNDFYETLRSIYTPLDLETYSDTKKACLSENREQLWKFWDMCEEASAETGKPFSIVKALYDAFEVITQSPKYDHIVRLRSDGVMAWDKPALCPLASWMIDSAEEGNHPYFNSILSRLKNSEETKPVLMAFIWKIFKEDDYGRQLLWGRSAGNAGQTTFWKAVYSVIENVTSVIRESGHWNQFVESGFLNKRLLVATDTAERQLLEKPIIKRITGNDTSLVEQKFKQPFTAVLYSRVVVTSNYYPEIDTLDVSQKSRLLLIEFESITDKPNQNFLTNLKKEIWNFLKSCRTAERTLCGDSNDEIPIPPSMEENIDRNCEFQERLLLKTLIQNKVVVYPETDPRYITHKLYQKDIVRCWANLIAASQTRRVGRPSNKSSEKYLQNIRRCMEKYKSIGLTIDGVDPHPYYRGCYMKDEEDFGVSESSFDGTVETQDREEEMTVI